ncbi:unnamed protein product [Blepharisma stoltei]|uniref:C2H2-type domain-containing protein n=1 Tax=Blepharisma stoltei TaxID=1481888 RepID=A0AAU9IR26_9CILI|nr:unnamed protein product [Blepharisma stoltei]
MSIPKILTREVKLGEIEFLTYFKKRSSLHSFECNLCFTRFETCEQLKAHFRAEQEFGRDADNFLECEGNEEEHSKPVNQFEVVAQCKDKKDKAEGKMKCPKCSKMLKSLKGLEQHIAKMHISIRKKSLCKSCGKYFKNKYAMVFHVKQVHEKSTRVVCEICKQIIYNKYSLQAHIEKCHSSLFSI